MWLLAKYCPNDAILAGRPKFADFVAKSFHLWQQDSTFFIGSLKTALLVPKMFTSDCPAFMPVEYSDRIEHRLDNNILFYEKIGQVRYNLVDIFAIKGGRAIVLDMGTWEKGSGLQLERKINRWDRRNDLMGAKFVNTFKYNRDYSYFIYNNSNGEIVLQNESRCCNGTIIGSGGTYQDLLFYMTDRLNITVETRNETRLIKGRPKKRYASVW